MGRSRERERLRRRSRSRDHGRRNDDRRSRSRDLDRPSRRYRSRSPVHRSPSSHRSSDKHDRSRDHERSRDSKLSSSSSSSSKHSTAAKVSSKPVEIVDLTNDDKDMMQLMGFCSFDSTKGKKVEGNDVGAVHVVLKRKYRQYMNRKGGFNRPLDFVA